MASSPHDIYQARYLEHRTRKKKLIRSKQLLDLLRDRRSQRTFNGSELAEAELGQIYEAIRLSPSSCNRQAILVKPVVETTMKDMLEYFLVGGRDWLGDAAIILLLFADMLAYKSPAEKDFMPYLDAGFIAENIYLMANAQGIGACFVNPNIREKDKADFDGIFNPRGHRFCGAVALGKYDIKAPEVSKRTIGEIFYC